MADSEDDDQDKLEYLSKGLLQPLVDRSSWRRSSSPSGREQKDDDSNQMFMSEPSMSEADSSDNLLRLLSPADSFTEDDMGQVFSPDEEEDRYLLMPPPPPPTRLLNAAQQSAHSPGNTSLSSWESPHISRQVRVHFSPEQHEHHKQQAETFGGTAEKQLYMPSHYPWGGEKSNISNLRNRADPPPPSDQVGLVVAGNGDRSRAGSDYPRSSASTSSVSEGQQKRLEHFLEDLRVTSKGQMQESAGGANISFESAHVSKPEPDMNGVLRRLVRHERVSSIDTALVQNTSVNGGSGNDVAPTDDTIVMTLSASDEDGTKESSRKDDDGRTSDFDHHNSADDELTAPRKMRTKQTPSHRRKLSGDASGGHRRQRSGDAAAATMLTGSKDWKGMEQDKIPLPPLPNEQDDEDDDDAEQDGKAPNGHVDSIHSKSGIDGGYSNSRRNKPATSAGVMGVAQFSQFALGSASSGTIPSYVNRQARRSRRDSKSRQKRDSNVNVDVPDSKFAFDNAPTPSSTSDGHDRSPTSNSDSFEKPPLSPSRHHAFPNSEPAQQPRGPRNSFSGGLPQWNQTQSERPAHRKTQSHQHGFYNPGASLWGNHDAPGAIPGYRRMQMPFLSPQLGHHSRKSHDFYQNPHEQWGQSSISSAESSFSWLSNRQMNSFERQDLELSPFWNPPRKHHPVDPTITDVREESKHDPMNDSESSSSSSSDDVERISVQELRSAHHPSPPHVVRHHQSPFANIGKSFERADRRRFLPQTFAHMDSGDEKKFSTYICPRCKTRQREYFTVSDAPRQFETASGYVALYFVIYVIAALYIFGLQEGWPALDCIYFAVITLTTAGLGDFVPTSDGSKILCSVFIYFGVACIGLLLGSYIAGMLDESSRREAKNNRIDSCPNCLRIKTMKDATERQQIAFAGGRRKSTEFPPGGPPSFGGNQGAHAFSERTDSEIPAADRQPSKKLKRDPRGNIPGALNLSEHLTASTSPNKPRGKSEKSPKEANSPTLETLDVPLGGLSNQHYGRDAPPGTPSPSNQNHLLGSPLTAQILGRQSHTRHTSFDLNSTQMSAAMFSKRNRGRNFSAELPALEEAGDISKDSQPTPIPPPPPPQLPAEPTDNEDEDEESSESSDDSSSCYSSEDEDEKGGQVSRVKNAKYVFLTLKEALVNSMVIIAFGCLGFYFIEGFSIVDSWYFTTVLLTTVGYGDIVPITKGGKLFATVYILVAGTILLNNMSLISMIPLELRKRRIERAVLTQFGDQLDDSALRELATGPLIQRLNLSSQRPGGLNECTREMFSLAMLVRLGKVTEQDLRSTFAAFRRLDVNNEGILNSKSIIAAMIQKRRSVASLARPMGPPQLNGTPATPVFIRQPEPPPPPSGPYWVGTNNNLYYGGGAADFPASYHYSPMGPQIQDIYDVQTPANENSSLFRGNTPYGSYVMSANDSTRSF